jgi:hypothetical protein
MYKKICLIVLISIYFTNHYASALHCLNHNQCGDHAACISTGINGTPKCMCLVGYFGNGAICTESGSEQASSVRVGLASGRQVDEEILRRTLCKSASASVSASGIGGTDPVDDLATDQPLIDLPRLSQRKETVLKETSAQNSFGSLLSQAKNNRIQTFNSVTPKFITSNSQCPKLECDFDDGPCAYKNMLKSFWYVRDTAFFDTPTGEQSQNLVATAKGEESQEHFLTSDTVFLPERVNMTFEYFESDHFPHLSVCQDNTTTGCTWTSDGKGGWRSGRIELSPGNHKVIFAARELSHARSVAIDNVKVENVFGSSASCS